MALKVFGGMSYDDGKQVRTIVATTSKKKVSELTGVSYGEVRSNWCETNNDLELATALPYPNLVFKASNSMGKDFKAEIPENYEVGE